MHYRSTASTRRPPLTTVHLASSHSTVCSISCPIVLGLSSGYKNCTNSSVTPPTCLWWLSHPVLAMSNQWPVQCLLLGLVDCCVSCSSTPSNSMNHVSLLCSLCWLESQIQNQRIFSRRHDHILPVACELWAIVWGSVQCLSAADVHDVGWDEGYNRWYGQGWFD